MTQDHRHCDELFENIENFVSKKEFERAGILLENWIKKNLTHFETEEEIIFKKLDEKMGMIIPPVQMMLHEHSQIRNLIKQMRDSLKDKDSALFLGTAESCFMMIQQHNMKEEQILYPLIDKNLTNEAEFHELVKERIK